MAALACEGKYDVAVQDDCTEMKRCRFASKESTAIASDSASIADCAASSFSRESEIEETGDALIIFDWDDTLCPTTHQEANPECAVQEAAELEEHAEAVENLLRVASGLGRVSIVTMAAAGWVEETTEKLMPSVKATLDELEVNVSLARVGLPARCMREAFGEGRSPSHYLKRRAMTQVVRKSLKERRGAWKNIVSIGDSDAEHYALQDVMLTLSELGATYGKTVKLKSEPTLAELTAQVRTLTQWLPTMVRHNGDLHFDAGEDDLQSPK